MDRILGLDFRIMKTAHVQEDLSMEMILLYIADGKAHISVGGNRMNFGERGILLIEPGFPYEINAAGQSEVTIAEARYSPELFSQVAGSENFLLCCNSETDRIHSYEDLRTIFYELIRYWIYRRKNTPCLRWVDLGILENKVFKDSL
jgi:hypothetical protein